MKKALSVVLIFVAILSYVEASAQTNYKTYSNTRFGYSISYPSDLIVPQGEADNGDGQKFLAKDECAEMLVYGRLKLEANDTLKKIYNTAIADLGDKATYKVLKSNWFVVSGKRNGKIYYQKTMLKRDIFITFSIEYDESKNATYDAVTTRIVKSFVG